MARRFCVGCRPNRSLLPEAGLIVPTDTKAHEIAITWDAIKDSDDAEDFAEFLEHYGAFRPSLLVRQAAKRLAALKAPERTVRPRRLRIVEPAPVPEPVAEETIDAAEADVFLRLDPGMHTAMIRRVSVSADGALMATGAYDKTVRLWSLPEGELVRTFRPPIGDGNEGKVYAVALDPAGQWVAAGGWTIPT